MTTVAEAANDRWSSRENERRARFLGIPVERHIWIAFSLSCFFMGFAGALFTSLGDEFLHLVFEQSLGPLSQPAFVVGMFFAAQKSHQHLPGV